MIAKLQSLVDYPSYSYRAKTKKSSSLLFEKKIHIYILIYYGATLFFHNIGYSESVPASADLIICSLAYKNTSTRRFVASLTVFS